MLKIRKGVATINNLLSHVHWSDKKETVDYLINQGSDLSIEPMIPGFEADVIRVNADRGSFVLKVWNKSSRPDISRQFYLLEALHERGIRVSNPIGFGKNPNEEQVLLTSFDGLGITKLNETKLSHLASILVAIHHTSLGEGEVALLPQYDFIDYFYPGVREYHDLSELLEGLVGIAELKQDHLIHGDFHLNNIVEDGERLTVIDWTNAQWGDPRYDFAWSLILMKIYLSDKYASIFRAKYLQENKISSDEVELFEAIACLRWILLNRSGNTPRGAQTMDKVKTIITSNKYLREREFYDLPRKKKVVKGDQMNIDAVFEKFPILSSDASSYVLKKIEACHLDEVYEIYSNDQVFEYCGIIPKHNKSTVQSMIGHFERDYNKRSRVKWGIFAVEQSSRLVGIIEAMDFDQKVNKVTIGYFLAESQWGRGIAAAALQILIKFLFEEANVNRIQAEVMPLNTRSKRVLLKNNFILEGTLRQAAVWSGKGVVDLEIYSILQEDYRQA